MSSIETYLQYIANKVWAREVRTAIVNAIRQCYDDVHNPTLNTEALQAAIQAKIDAGQMAALTIGDRTITAAKLALGVIPTPDTTLSQSGVPADAKTTGDEISTLQADLGNKVGIVHMTENLIIALNNDPVSLTPLVESGWSYAVLDCTEGDKFVINASGGNRPRAWGFIDSSNHILSVADARASFVDLELTAPANAVKLIINDNSGGMSYKVGNNLATKANKTSNGLSDEAKAALLACFDHVVWHGEGDDYYNNLRRTLFGEDPFYDTWVWSSQATGDGALTRMLSGCTESIVNPNKGISYNNTSASLQNNKRRSFLVAKGKATVKGEGSEVDYYPIPIPKTATKATVTITPSSQQIGVYIFKLGDVSSSDGYHYDKYPQTPGISWVTGSSTIEFAASEDLFLALQCRVNASDAYSSATEPNLTIAFE